MAVTLLRGASERILWLCHGCQPVLHTAPLLPSSCAPLPACPPPCSLGDAVTAVAGSVRENVRLRRGFRLGVDPGGAVGVYVHAGVGMEGLGRIAGLVALESQPPATGEAAAAVEALARQLAMQVGGEALAAEGVVGRCWWVAGCGLGARGMVLGPSCPRQPRRRGGGS